ncbi:hypothetical protein JCM3770_003719 [Rhodotorula araucariae]
MGRDLDRFQIELPEHLHCTVCYEAAYPPVLYCAPPGEHLLCEACYHLLQNSVAGTTMPMPPCPTCREPPRGDIFVNRISVSFKRAIESYDYACDKRKCDWVGSLSNEAAYDLACVGRIAHCLYCKALAQYNEFQAHYSICPEMIIDCPRGGPDCGGAENSARMRRRNMEMHHEPCCTMYPWTVTAGCPTRTTLANRRDHEVACELLRDALDDAQVQLAEMCLMLREEQQAHERTKKSSIKPLAKKPIVPNFVLEIIDRPRLLPSGDTPDDDIQIVGSSSRTARKLVLVHIAMSAALPAPRAPALAPGPSPTAKLPSWLVRTAESPAFAWTTSASLLAALPLCVKRPLGFPQLIQLPLFAAVFGGSGYMISAGDPLNGSGTTTAWSLVYLFLNGRAALAARRPGPIALAGVVAAQAGTYGGYYFGQD